MARRVAIMPDRIHVHLLPGESRPFGGRSPRLRLGLKFGIWLRARRNPQRPLLVAPRSRSLDHGHQEYLGSAAAGLASAKDQHPVLARTAAMVSGPGISSELTPSTCSSPMRRTSPEPAAAPVGGSKAEVMVAAGACTSCRHLDRTRPGAMFAVQVLRDSDWK